MRRIYADPRTPAGVEEFHAAKRVVDASGPVVTILTIFPDFTGNFPYFGYNRCRRNDFNMQCEYVTSVGQCSKQATPPSRFCDAHSATNAERVINQYRITNSLLGDPIDRHARANEIKSIHTEIAILRSLLERRINQCETEADVVANTAVFQSLALAIDKLATSCHTMDVKLGNSLSKQAVMSLAQKLIGIIDANVRPLANTTPSTGLVDETIENIGLQIASAIAAQEN